MSFWSKLKGTINTTFSIGLGGATLKNSSGNLLVRNAADSADAQITASKVNMSGDVLDINSDAAGAGADWKYTLQRPTSGMTAAVVLTLPVDDGSANQVLQTDGNGVLSWASAGTTSHLMATDTTSLAFGSGTVVSAFTLPANAVVNLVVIIVDTAFNGTPSLSVGLNGGSASAFVASTDLDLKVADRYEIPVQVAPVGTTGAVELYYTAGGASAGAARVIFHYSIPA